jgi:hypothetical protein
MSNNIIGYFLDPDALVNLNWIKKNLFGDGSSLDPDLRRDMANTLDIILHELMPIREDQINES